MSLDDLKKDFEKFNNTIKFMDEKHKKDLESITESIKKCERFEREKNNNNNIKWVKCIKSRCHTDITVGRKYQIVSENMYDGWIEIVNDKRIEHVYSDDLFETCKPIDSAIVVVPEKKYRPFRTFDELQKSMEAHGEWVDDCGVFRKIVSVKFDDSKIKYINDVPVNSTCHNWKFLDRTPFGVLEKI